MNADKTTTLLAGLADVFEVDPGTVQSDFSVAERWDSLAVLATIALIDEQFDVTVPIDELTACRSVADVLTLIGQSVDQRSAAR